MTDEDNWVAETFGERVKEVDDVTIEDVEDWYTDKIDQYGDEKMARVAVQADFNSWINTGADGNVKMITIGAQDDPFNNGDVFVGYALCIPEDQPVKLGVVEFRRDTVDADSMMHHFYEPYNTIAGDFDIQNAEKPVGSNAYKLSAVENTTIEEYEGEKSREELKEMVDDYIDTTKISEIGDNLSLTNDSGFAAAFGVDLRKIEGAYVHEVRVGENAARLVVQDDSFVDARDLGSDITGEDGDQGLAGFADPDIIEFGEASFVDLFGAVTPTQDGQVLMSIYGVDPIQATEAPDTGNNGGSSGSSSSASEDNVGGTGAGADEERTI